jgi:hypothetical protein
MQFRSFAFLLILVYATWLAGCSELPAATTAATTAPATTTVATTKTSDEDYCFKCHEVQEGTSVAFKNDIHYGNALSCADCHGGNPKINDMDRSKAPESGFRIRVERQDVPMFCAGCHSNSKFMALYDSKLPTNQVALYGRSVHGIALANGKTEAAECIDCHGIHDIREVSSPESPVNPRRINNTCVKCHTQEAALLRQNRAHSNRTNCVMCHGGGHTIPTATTALLTGTNQGCGRCHRGNSGQARTAAQIAQFLTGLENAGPQSKDALARARRAVHSFNLGAVQRAANTPATRSAADDRETRTVSVAARSPFVSVAVRAATKDNDVR